MCTQFLNRILKGVLLCVFNLVLVFNQAYAIDLTAEDMVKNIAATVPELMLFVTAFSYVMGFFLVFNGMMHLKKFAEQRTMMSGDHKWSVPLLSLFAGAALIYLPSAVQSGMTTFWLDPKPYAYDLNNGEEWNTFISACFQIIQLVGVIAFIRGLLVVTHLGGHGGQATFGKALALMVSGVFCIDMYDFITAVFNTLGLGSLLPATS